MKKSVSVGFALLGMIPSVAMADVPAQTAPMPVEVSGVQYDDENGTYVPNNSPLQQLDKSLIVNGDINISAKQAYLPIQGKDITMKNIRLNLGQGIDKGGQNTIYINNGMVSTGGEGIPTKAIDTLKGGNIYIRNGVIDIMAKSIELGDITLEKYSRLLFDGNNTDKIAIGKLIIETDVNPVSEFQAPRSRNTKIGTFTSKDISIKGSTKGNPLVIYAKDISIDGLLEAQNVGTGELRRANAVIKAENSLNITKGVKASNHGYIDLTLVNKDLQNIGPITVQDSKLEINNFFDDVTDPNNPQLHGHDISISDKISNVRGKTTIVGKSISLGDVDNKDGSTLDLQSYAGETMRIGYKIDSSDKEYDIVANNVLNKGTDINGNMANINLKGKSAHFHALEGYEQNSDMSYVELALKNTALTIDEVKNKNIFLFTHVDAKNADSSNKVILNKPATINNFVFFLKDFYGLDQDTLEPEYKLLSLVKNDPQSPAAKGVHPIIPIINVKHASKDDKSIKKWDVYDADTPGKDHLWIKSAKYNNPTYASVFKEYFPDGKFWDTIYYLGFKSDEVAPDVLPIELTEGPAAGMSVLYDLITADKGNINRGYGNYMPKETKDTGLWATIRESRVGHKEQYLGDNHQIAVGFNGQHNQHNYGIALRYDNIHGNMQALAGDVSGHSVWLEGYDQIVWPKQYYGTLKVKMGRATSKYNTGYEGVDVHGKLAKEFKGFGLELGRRIELKHGNYLAPQIEWSMASIGGDSFKDENGLMYRMDGIDSRLLRIGLTYGHRFEKSNHNSTLYFAGNYFHEYDGRSTVSVVDGDGLAATQTMNYGGVWGNIGLGYTTVNNNSMRTYLSYAHSFGNKVKNDSFNLGMKWIF